MGGSVTSLLLKALRLVLGIGLMLAVLLICANSFGRYALHQPILWAEEVLGYSLVWMVYLGSILVTIERQHLKMDLVSKMFGQRVQAALEMFGAGVFAVVGGIIVYQSFGSIGSLSHRSQVADLPMNIVHSVVPASFAVMVFVTLVLALRDLRGLPGQPQQDASGKQLL
jgi:TRAP-type C4-dicarboxylate transport system permease small subunit